MKEIRYLSRKISVVEPDEDGKDVNQKVWDEYHGGDVDGSGVDLQKGDTAVVSNAKAAQLERDFPDLFEVVRDVEVEDEPEVPPTAEQPPPPPADDEEPEPTLPSVEQMAKAKRDDLDKLAAAIGVEEPKKLANKDAVAQAISDRYAELQTTAPEDELVAVLAKLTKAFG